MNLKLKAFAFFLTLAMSASPAQAGFTSRLLKHLSDYVQEVKGSKGAALVIRQAPPKTDKFLYGHAFTKLAPPRPGRIGKAQKIYNYFPSLVAQTIIRKKNYKFTPVHSLAEDVIGLGVLDAPVHKLSSYFTKPQRLTLLTKMGLSMPVFLWFYNYTEVDAIKSRQRKASVQQHQQTLWHFVQHDFRGQALKKMHEDGLITRQQSLDYALQYMQALKEYYIHFDSQSQSPSLDQTLTEYEQNPLFANTYTLLMNLNYIQFTPGQEPPVCHKEYRTRVEKIFQLTHLSLYQHRFLDAWLFQTEDKTSLQNLQHNEYKWYTLLNDFTSDPYVKALFEAREQQALNSDELKYLLHQDVQDQFLWRTAQVLKHSMAASLDELRQSILNDLWARHRLLN